MFREPRIVEMASWMLFGWPATESAKVNKEEKPSPQASIKPWAIGVFVIGRHYYSKIQIIIDLENIQVEK